MHPELRPRSFLLPLVSVAMAGALGAVPAAAAPKAAPLAVADLRCDYQK